MSHDQKPGKMRVVGSATPARRRTDAAAPASGHTGPASAAAAAAPATKSRPLLVLLFILGCALGGAALPLLGLL